MRQILMGDIVAVARSLMDVPPQMQASAANTMFYRAHVADKFMKRTGVPHPVWGNGSLLACAASGPSKAEPFPNNLAYLSSLGLVIEELIAWKRLRCRSIRRVE